MNKKHLLTLLLFLFFFLVLPSFLRNSKPQKVNTDVYAACYSYTETWTTHHCEWSSNLGYQCVRSSQSETVCDDPNCTGESDIYTQEATECDVVNDGCEIDDHGARAWCTQIPESDPGDPVDPGDPDVPDPPPGPEPDANCPSNKPSKWCVKSDHDCGSCQNKGIQLSYCASDNPRLCCCPVPGGSSCGGNVAISISNPPDDSETTDMSPNATVSIASARNIDRVQVRLCSAGGCPREDILYGTLADGSCASSSEDSSAGLAFYHFPDGKKIQTFTFEMCGNLPLGGYRYRAKAYNDDNDCDPNTTSVDFNVVQNPPIVLNTSLNKDDGNDSSQNFVSNGNFELNFQDWNSEGGSIVTESDTGFKAAHVTGAANGTRSRVIQWVNIDDLTEYTLSFSYKKTGGTISADDYCLGGAAGNQSTVPLRITTDASSYERVHQTFLSADCDDDQTHKVAIYADTYSNSQDIWLDGVFLEIGDSDGEYNDILHQSVFQEDALIVNAYYYDSDTPRNNLLLNPSFENGFNHWSKWNDPDTLVNTDEHKFGQKALKCKAPLGANGTVFQVVPSSKFSDGINIGDEFTASIWVRSLSGNREARLCIIEHDGSAGIKWHCNSQFIDQSDGWQRLRTATVIEKAETTQLVFDLGLFDSSVDYVFDGALLETGTTQGVFTDMSNWQFALERQNTTLSGGVFVGGYNSSLWPMRLGFFRDRSNYNKDSFQFGVGDNIWDSSTTSYDSSTKRFYLENDINNIRGVNYYDILGGKDNTFFELLGDGGIKTQWTVKFNSDFPSESYYATSYVADVSGAEDEETPELLYISDNWYFHRMGTLDFIGPQVDIKFYEDNNSTASSLGDYCTGPTDTPLELAGDRVTITHSGGDDVTSFTNATEVLNIIPSVYQDNYQISLDLNEDQSYICTCGMTGPFSCQYTQAEATHVANKSVNFFIRSVDLSNDAWFQTVGGNIWANGNIHSFIPYNDVDGPCITANDCQPALTAASPYSSGVNDSPGFPIAQGTGSYISTHKDNPETNQDTLIHLDSDRSQAADGHAKELQMPLSNRGYVYYYNKFGFEYYDDPTFEIDIGVGVNDNTPTGLTPDDLNVLFAKGDLDISSDYDWSIASDETLVVFVDGDLNIIGSPDNQVTNVAEGGFLAFIVSGDIIVQDDIGYTPLTQDDIAAAFSLPSDVAPNLEGIFIADGSITIQSSGTDTRDNKFIGAGTFVGWGGVSLERDFDDDELGNSLHNFNPTETFIHRPDLLVNMPIEMKEALHEWREVDPTRQ